MHQLLCPLAAASAAARPPAATTPHHHNHCSSSCLVVRLIAAAAALAPQRIQQPFLIPILLPDPKTASPIIPVTLKTLFFVLVILLIFVKTLVVDRDIEFVRVYPGCQSFLIQISKLLTQRVDSLFIQV
jgi:hypothetical protein